MRKRSPARPEWFLAAAFALLLNGCGSEPVADPGSDWLDRFLKAYSAFEGSHLVFYADDARLVDEMSGLVFDGREAIEALFEQASSTYSTIDWQVEARVREGNRVVARGRVTGAVADRDFDVAFTSWFRLSGERIVHQVDFVDYGVLRSQVRPAATPEESRKTTTEKGNENMAKVTGIGGVFFLAKDKGDALSSWYREHLGMAAEDFGGTIFQWNSESEADGGMTVWHVADGDSEWFKPADARFMINYRVDDLEALIAQLKADGIDILQGPEYHENGIFAWIQDPDGNKVELWEAMPWDDGNKR